MKLLLFLVLIILVISIKMKYESFTSSSTSQISLTDNLINFLSKDDKIIRELIHNEEELNKECNDFSKDNCSTNDCYWNKSKCISITQKKLNEFIEYKNNLLNHKHLKLKDLDRLELIKNSYNNTKKELAKLYYNRFKPNNNFFESQRIFNERLKNFINNSSDNGSSSGIGSNTNKITLKNQNNKDLVLTKIDNVEQHYIINFNNNNNDILTNNYLKFEYGENKENIIDNPIPTKSSADDDNIDKAYIFKLVEIINENHLNNYINNVNKIGIEGERVLRKKIADIINYRNSNNELITLQNKLKIVNSYNLQYPFFIVFPLNSDYEKVLTIRNNWVSIEPINYLNSIRNQTFKIVY